MRRGGILDQSDSATMSGLVPTKVCPAHRRERTPRRPDHVLVPPRLASCPEPDAGGLRPGEVTRENDVDIATADQLLDGRRCQRLQLALVLNCTRGLWLTNNTVPIGVSELGNGAAPNEVGRIDPRCHEQVDFGDANEAHRLHDRATVPSPFRWP